MYPRALIPVLGAVAVAALVVSATAQVRPRVDPNRIVVPFSLTCRAQGTPTEFPDDIVIINSGAIPIVAGTTIAWKMTTPARQGSTVLAVTLEPGKSVFLSGAIGMGVGAGTPCSARVI